MNPQLELIYENLTQEDVDQFIHLLKSRPPTDAWINRKQLIQLTGKTERDIRILAEAAGPDIVRGQKGFAWFDNATLDEIHKAADQQIAQSKKMMRYGIRLKRRAHARLETTQPSAA